MILKGIKVLAAHEQPDGSYSYDLELPDALVSGDESWINKTNLHNGWGWHPGGQYVSVISAPADGRGAGLFAIQTANTVPGAMYSNIDFILRQNMLAKYGSCYGYLLYGEVFREACVHKDSYAHGIELAAINRHPYVARVTPWHPNPRGMVELLRLMAEELGANDDPAHPKPAYDVSVAFTIGAGNGGKRFMTGINCMAGAIHPDGEFAALPEGVPIAWYAEDGTRTRITVKAGKLINMDEQGEMI